MTTEKLKFNMQGIEQLVNQYGDCFSENEDCTFIMYYDSSNGDVWINEYYGSNSWTQYHDPDIFFIKRFNSWDNLPTEDYIIDIIEDYMEEENI